MLKEIICEDFNLETAIRAGLEKLNCTESEADVEILLNAKKGFLGVGATKGKVKISIKDSVYKQKAEALEALQRKQAEEKAKKLQLEKMLKEEAKKKEEEAIRLETEHIKESILEYSEKLNNYIYNLQTGFTLVITYLQENNVKITPEDYYEDLLEMQKAFINHKKTGEDHTDSHIVNVINKIYQKYIPKDKYNVKFIKNGDEYQICYFESLETIKKKIIGPKPLIYPLFSALVIGDYQYLPNEAERKNTLQNCSDLETSFTYDLAIVELYLKLLISFSKMPKFFENSKALKNNSELFTIIKNDTIEGINLFRYDTTYSIYSSYYQNTFKDTLSPEEFTAVVNVALISEDVHFDNAEDNKFLLSFGIDTDATIKIAQRERAPEATPYSYIATTMLNNGYFDSIMGMEESTMLVNAFINTSIRVLLKTSDIQDFILFAYETVGVKQMFNLYNEKYKLLNRTHDKSDKIKQIYEMYNNAVTGEDFEEVLKNIYEAMNYKVTTTPKTGDQGADLILERNNIKTVLQAKYYSSPVGNSAVQEVVGAIKYYEADLGIVVTNSTFTKSAMELARSNNIDMVDGAALKSMIKKLL